MRKLPLSILSEFIPAERIIGFTIPTDGSFLICDHDAVWRISTRPSFVVAPTDDDPYVVSDRPDFVGWGKADAVPILRYGELAIEYDFDPKADSVRLRFASSLEEAIVEFPTFSGDWFAASLSREGDLLVLAEPYQIGLYSTE